MPILTDAFITNALGFGGSAEYDALLPSVASKSQMIGLADAVVEAAARKGGYSTVTAAVPPTGSALLLLQQMSFVVWLRLASRARQISLPDEVVADWPRPFWLYVAEDDQNRLDLPGLTRDSLNSPNGARISNGYGTDGTTPNTPVFSLSTWTRFP